MIGKYTTLFALENYRHSSDIDGTIYHGLFGGYNSSLLIDLIWAETCLRTTIQREEALTKKKRATEKALILDIKSSQLGTLEEELIKVRTLRSHYERNLYEQESMLPRTWLRKGYNSVKRNPAWYLRKELIDDCIGKGGCCSRGCGCCETRRLSAGKGRGKGIGHCTAECICCIHDRGCEFTAKEKKGFDERFDRMLRSDNPAFLLKMANAYFSRPLVWKGKAKGRFIKA